MPTPEQIEEALKWADETGRYYDDYDLHVCRLAAAYREAVARAEKAEGERDQYRRVFSEAVLYVSDQIVTVKGYPEHRNRDWREVMAILRKALPEGAAP